jgi:hypothetical protein
MTTIASGGTKATGFQAGLQKSLVYGKVRILSNYMRVANSFEGQKNGFTSRLRLGGSYAPARAHRFQFDFTALTNESQTAIVSRDFKESTTRLTYIFSFDTQTNKKK